MPVQSPRRHLYESLWATPVKSLLSRVPLVRQIYSGWARPHPFDLAHGIGTSGFVPASECATGDVPALAINFYGGSQPSIARTVLASLPEPEHYAFVDIGCGKGRPLVVASEFPFQRVVGVELAPRLLRIARTNAATLVKALVENVERRLGHGLEHANELPRVGTLT